MTFFAQARTGKSSVSLGLNVWSMMRINSCHCRAALSSQQTLVSQEVIVLLP